MEAPIEKFVLAGGGTGGHVFPAVAIAREILRQRPSARVLFMGTRKGLEAMIIPREGFPIEFIPASGFAGKNWGAKTVAVGALACGVAASWRRLRRIAPRAVLGVGGYASLPVLLAGRLLAIPTMIEEQNSVPGIANRIAARAARRAVVGFPGAAARLRTQCEWTGNPVREEFFSVTPLKLRPPGRNVLMLGGSQGARPLNTALVGAAPRLEAEKISVVAQVGDVHFEEISSELARFPHIRVEKFLLRPWEEMTRADLVVCRAGALTLAELCAAGRPAILVPFAAAAANHQEENAREVEAAGGALVVSEKEWDGAAFVREVLPLLDDRARLEQMAAAARSLAKPGAAARIVEILFSMAGGA